MKFITSIGYYIINHKLYTFAFLRIQNNYPIVNYRKEPASKPGRRQLQQKDSKMKSKKKRIDKNEKPKGGGWFNFQKLP